jgi:hypothetical protein
MNDKIISIVVVVLLLTGCNGNGDFLIEKGRVGKLTKSTIVNDLASIFSNDSLVIRLSEGDLSSDENKYFHEDDQYLVYEKGGKHLLTLIPVEQHDSLSGLKSIEIFDNRYKTKKGISLYSPFKDINSAYQVSLTNTLLSAHIDIDELNATMSIDKKDIGINEFNREEIIPENIPDLALVKHFTIWFN